MKPHIFHPQIRGARLWLEVQGAGPPVVMCHGGPGAYDYLGPVAEMLEDCYTVVRYDQRGAGRSTGVGPFTLSNFINDLDGVRDYLGIETWVVGGHSWGASLALAYAATYPQHTSGLLYLNGVGLDPKWHDDYQQNRLQKLGHEDRIRLRNLNRARGAVSSSRELDMIDAERRAIIAPTDMADPAITPPTFNTHTTSNVINKTLSAELDDLLPQLRRAAVNLACPALVVHGAHDPRPLHSATLVSESIRGAELVVMPNTGHYPWLEEAELLKSTMRGFLSTFDEPVIAA